MPTSPAPDAAAPPGMCPGIVVKGGGSGGGGGDGSGNGGGDGSSGDGSGNGDGAAGDSKSAGSCGAGGNGGKCPNHHPGGGSGKVSAGDPVDAVTGRVFTIPALDMELGGAFPLSIMRSYSSGSHSRDIGLGFGWSHSLAWEIQVFRRKIRIWKWDGTYVELPPPPMDDGVVGPGGWVLVRTKDGYVLDIGDQTQMFFSEAQDGGKRFRLSAVRDWHGNTIALRYEGGRLAEITDSGGRLVRAAPTREGRIAAFEVKNAASQGRWVAFARYTYDERGDLVAATDADGYVTAFTYSDHLLTSHTDPTGLTFYFRYDERDRCVETWGRRAHGEDPSLTASAPRLLADGTTKSKGILHCVLAFYEHGYSEVIDSISVQRFFGNGFGKVDKAVSGGSVYSRTYDELGNVSSFTDPLGATSTWKRDGRGRVIKAEDPLGRVTTIERDPDGHVRRVVEPGGAVTEVTRLRDGLTWTDPIGAVFVVKQDDRGRVTETIAPDGARTVYRYDALDNLVEKVDPLGGRTELLYDYFGRCTAIRDPTGATKHYTYSARGDIVAERNADDGVTRYTYDGNRDLTAITRPNGQTTHLVRGGYRSLLELRRANGEVYKFRYDREGRLAEVHNPRGEIYAFELNRAGRVVNERTFDGRELRYRYDPCGNLVSATNGLGQKTDYTYDLAGQLVSRAYADGTGDAFMYDVAGNIVRATSGSIETVFEWNALGWLVKETQIVGCEAVAVERDYDAMGATSRRATSLGHTAEWARDIGGRARRMRLDGGGEVLFSHDVVGREVTRLLPEGGRIDTAYDAMGRIARRRVTAPSAQVSVAPNEPAWVGHRYTGVTVDQAYRYALTGEVVESWDQASGLRRFEYDPEGQILAVLPEKAQAELYRYDVTGNVFDAGPSREDRAYGPGNRLLRKGGTEYTWDRDGRLERMCTRTSTGDEHVTRYRWSASGLLLAVERPDGSRVECTYDAFARRVMKQVFAPPDRDRRSRRQHVTRYVWDRSVLVHEIKQSSEAAGDPIVEERTYCFDEDTGAAWAQRTERRTSEGTLSGGWFHFLNDELGTPERLVGPDGAVACEFVRTAWGRARPADGAVTSTPLRFRGQYEDEETGLSYNRYRYYDPGLGRYISNDPIGIYGGFNGFSYADNRPTRFVDPNGLFPTSEVTEPGKKKPIATGTSAGTPGAQPHPKDPAITQAVENARKNAPNGPTNSHGNCAEIDALHKMASDIRNERKGKGLTKEDPDEENIAVRKELQKKFKDGAKMTTKDKDGNTMSPCTSCGQIMRELGLHPDSEVGKDIPSKGGIMGRDGKKWDGKECQQGKNKIVAGAKAKTAPSTTPPFLG